MPEFTIRTPPADLAIVKEHLASNKKIQAIKHLRNTGKQYPPSDLNQRNPETGEMETVDDYRVGLRNAKHAVEVLAGTLRVESAEAIIAPTLKILSFKVETADGVVECDIDSLRLHLLDNMSSMSLSEMAHMAELAKYISDWQDSPRKDR